MWGQPTTLFWTDEIRALKDSRHPTLHLSTAMPLQINLQPPTLLIHLPKLVLCKLTQGDMQDHVCNLLSSETPNPGAGWLQPWWCL